MIKTKGKFSWQMAAVAIVLTNIEIGFAGEFKSNMNLFSNRCKSCIMDDGDQQFDQDVFIMIQIA